MARPKEIIDGLLWMSSSPGKWKPFEKRDAWLQEHGIKHVVALCNRAPEVHVEGIDVLHLPVVDSHTSIDERIPDVVVPQVVGWIDAGEPTLVSCLAGRSRSGLACALVLREKWSMTGDEALEELRTRRPNGVKYPGPEAYLRALPAP